jgi:hypothetical protein
MRKTQQEQQEHTHKEQLKSGQIKAKNQIKNKRNGKTKGTKIMCSKIPAKIQTH